MKTILNTIFISLFLSFAAQANEQFLRGIVVGSYIGSISNQQADNVCILYIKNGKKTFGVVEDFWNCQITLKWQNQTNKQIQFPVEWLIPVENLSMLEQLNAINSQAVYVINDRE